jgi:hypothetical protein
MGLFCVALSFSILFFIGTIDPAIELENVVPVLIGIFASINPFIAPEFPVLGSAPDLTATTAPPELVDPVPGLPNNFLNADCVCSSCDARFSSS